MKNKIKLIQKLSLKFLGSWKIVVPFLLLLIIFVTHSFVVSNESMKSSLLIGDRIFVNKYTDDVPTYGEIVVFKNPENTKIHYVKRCVGLPNDELFVSDNNLYLHLNQGNDYMKLQYKEKDMIQYQNKLWVKNPYNYEKNPSKTFDFSPIRVAKNEYFMMGDNRDDSEDSRFSGSVPYGLIEGKPWFIYFSMSDDWKIRWDRFFTTPN